MASSKVMMSSSTQKSDQNRNKITSSSTMTTFHSVYQSNPPTASTLLDAQITLIEAPIIPNNGANLPARKTSDDVWREIEARKKKKDDVMMKEEILEVENSSELMTLEDFLAKAGADEDGEDQDVKPLVPERLSGGFHVFDPMAIQPSPFSPIDDSIIGFGNGVEMMMSGSGSSGGSVRGKRGRMMMEPLDKAAQQRQQRMINNRASAARSRERKQALQVELETQATRLEEENKQLMKEKEERTKERFKQLMEKVVPVVEKRRPPRPLRRVNSM